MERVHEQTDTLLDAMMSLVIIWFREVYSKSRQIPPVTIAAVIFQVLSHCGVLKSPWNYKSTSNSSVEQIQSSWWLRLIKTSKLLHEILVYISIDMFIYEGVYLEPFYGSVNFALLLVIISLACNIIYVAWWKLFAFVSRNNNSNTTCCTTGFITLLLTLKVIVLLEYDGLVENDPNEGIIGSIIIYWILLLGYCILFDFRDSFVFYIGGHFIGLIYGCTCVGGLIDTGMSKISNGVIIHNENFNVTRRMFFELYIKTSASLGQMNIDEL